MMRRILPSGACLGTIVALACTDTSEPLGPKGSATDPSAAQHSSANEPYRCEGVASGVYHSVIVPRGADCLMIGAVVEHSVHAFPEATLRIRTSTIGQHVRGNDAVVQVVRSSVGGDINVNGGGPHPVHFDVVVCGATLPTGSVRVSHVTGGIAIDPARFPNLCLGQLNEIGGNIQISNNRITKFMSVAGNLVEGNGSIINNEGRAPKAVSANVFAGNLQCRSNTMPFVGGPNVASQASGQCFVGTP